MAEIVIIDDDLSVRKLGRALLEAAGHTVTEAPEGYTGIKAFHEVKPDLVITDIVMPDCEGIETIRTIREADKKIPILAMSGSGLLGEAGYLRMAMALGANANLRKPFLPDEFTLLVEKLLAEGRIKAPGA